MKTVIINRYFLVIITVGLLVFLHSINNQFVLDDPSQITGNPAVHSLANIPQLFLGSTFGGGTGLQGVYYKPVMSSVFTIIYSLFGESPTPYHLFQLIIHISNALLLFIFLKHLFKERVAFLLTLIFLVHPINSETVLYISNLQDTLFFFFGMLALLQLTKDRLTGRNYLLFTIFIVLSMLSKETGLLFLIIATIYRVIFFMPLDKNLLAISGSILATYLGLRFLAVGLPLSSDIPFPIMRATLWERILNIPQIVFHYLKTFLYPLDLAVGQQWLVREINWLNFYLPILIDIVFLSLILGFTTRLTGQNLKKYLFFLLWLILGLGLHLQIIPLDATVADRWMYFPLVGLLGMVGIMISDFRLRIKDSLIFNHYSVIILSIILISLLSLRSYIRSLDWKDGLTLAAHDTKVTTDSFVMENNYGFELINANRYPEAQTAIEKSIQLAPYWWLNWNNLGVVYRHEGKTDQAEQAFRKAAENTPTFYMPYENLAELLFYFKSPKEAETFIAQTSQKLALSDKLWFTLAITEYKLDSQDNALKAAQQALAINPNNQAYQQLVRALQNNQQIIFEPPKY